MPQEFFLKYKNMGVSEKVIKAATKGPEAKKVKIKELGGSKNHEFNVKPVSLTITCKGELIVFGQISHHLRFRTDDQCWFGFKKKGNTISPNSPEKMVVEKKEGGLVKTITGKLKPIGVAIGAYYGVDVGKYFDKLDEHADKLSFLDMDHGYEKAIKNFLLALSKNIKPPRSLTGPGITLYQHHMFGGKKLFIKKNENIKHLKTVGWNDRASSLVATIPEGLKLEIFKHDNFKGSKIEFGCGTHYIRDLKIHKLGDEITSCRWTKA